MKTKIIYILLIITIIGFIGITTLVIKQNNENNNSKVITNEITEERLKQLFDNSYNYYILYEGFEETSTGKFEMNNIEYTKVNNVKSIKEIDDLINDTFIEEKRINYYNNIFNNRNYIEISDGVYFEYKQHCDNININYENITINKIKDNIIFIDTIYTGVHAYYENNNWYLDAPLHFCE